MFTAMALVAVIIPVFNGARTIVRAIESALKQECAPPFEIVVVDDGSTDGTGEILAGYHGRIRVFRQENRGPAVARNTAVAHSSADYLAFLDADDVFKPEKLAQTVSKLESCSRAVMLFHDAVRLNRNGAEVAASYVAPENAYAPSMKEMLTRWWPIVPSTTVMRRTTFEACEGFAPEFRSAAYEDPDLWLRAREYGEFIYLAAPLAGYTVEPPAERLARYLPAQEIFIRRLRRRYGAAANGLIRSTRSSYVSALGYQGLMAMAAGDAPAARRYFATALYQRPIDVRSALRLLRTFLPLTVARRLSGRTKPRRINWRGREAP